MGRAYVGMLILACLFSDVEVEDEEDNEDEMVEQEDDENDGKVEDVWMVEPVVVLTPFTDRFRFRFLEDANLAIERVDTLDASRPFAPLTPLTPVVGMVSRCLDRYELMLVAMARYDTCDAAVQGVAEGRGRGEGER